MGAQRPTVNALMYALTDKYETHELKDLARAKFEEAVRQDWDSRAFAYATEQVCKSAYSSDRGLMCIVATTIN